MDDFDLEIAAELREPSSPLTELEYKVAYANKRLKLEKQSAEIEQQRVALTDRAALTHGIANSHPSTASRPSATVNSSAASTPSEPAGERSGFGGGGGGGGGGTARLALPKAKARPRVEQPEKNAPPFPTPRFALIDVEFVEVKGLSIDPESSDITFTQMDGTEINLGAIGPAAVAAAQAMQSQLPFSETSLFCKKLIKVRQSPDLLHAACMFDHSRRSHCVCAGG